MLRERSLPYGECVHKKITALMEAMRAFTEYATSFQEEQRMFVSTFSLLWFKTDEYKKCCHVYCSNS